MTRKDNEKDSERPHYYSQFWLDVAAGRRVIGAPRPEDGELAEPEVEVPSIRRAPRSNVAESYSDTYTTSSSKDESIEPEVDGDDLADGDDLSNLDLAVDDTTTPDEDFEDEDADEEGEDADEELLGEEDEEEEEEDDEWGGRGRKRGTRTVRPAKPAVKRPGKREPKRGF